MTSGEASWSVSQVEGNMCSVLYSLRGTYVWDSIVRTVNMIVQYVLWCHKLAQGTSFPYQQPCSLSPQPCMAWDRCSCRAHSRLGHPSGDNAWGCGSDEHNPGNDHLWLSSGEDWRLRLAWNSSLPRWMFLLRWRASRRTTIFSGIRSTVGGRVCSTWVHG